MDHDDDEGVGYISESHYLKSPSHQQAMALLQIPSRGGREGSISSSVSDMDVPIYSSENLTTRPSRPVESVSTKVCRYIPTVEIRSTAIYLFKRYILRVRMLFCFLCNSCYLLRDLLDSCNKLRVATIKEHRKCA